MVFKAQNTVLIFSLILFFSLGAVGVSHAVLSMNEVQYLFEQEKGQLWKEATAQEKKDFIRDIRGREEFQEGQFKGKKKKPNEDAGIVDMTTISENKKERAPYEVRSSFEAQTGIEWGDATEIEQRDFWKEYKLEEKKLKQEKKLYTREQKRLEKQRNRELNLKKKEIRLKKKLREREEALKSAELKRKRKEEKRKAKEKEQEWELFRQEFKDKRERSKER